MVTVSVLEGSSFAIGIGNAFFLAEVFRRQQRLGSSREFSLGLGLGILLAAAFMARFSYVVIHGIPWNEGLSPLSAHRGGFSILGAIGGASIALVGIALFFGLSPVVLAGETIPAWCLSSIFWRAGCHFSGCCHGAATTNSFWLAVGALTGSGAPGRIPFPAMEMALSLLLAIALGPVLDALVRADRLLVQAAHRTRVIIFVMSYGFFRVFAAIWQ